MLVVYHLQIVAGKSGGKENVSLVIGSFQRYISGSNGTSEKVVRFSGRNIPSGNSCSISSKPSLIPGSGLRGRFFGNLICTNAIPGRHLPVLNFPYHELYPNCESTGLPMQMVNNLCIRFHVQPELLPSWSQTMGTECPCRLTPIVPDIFGTVSSTDTKPKLGPTILRRILPQKPWQVDISIQLENLLSAWQYWWRTAAQTLAKRMHAAMAATARAI